MSPQPAEVVNLAEHVGNRLGQTCGGVELLADRRGSRVYRLQFTDDQPIAIDESAEVYALTAVLHLAWTGLPPTSYTHDQAPWRGKLEDVAQGRQHDLEAIRPWPWPAFENALRLALTPEPETERCR
ncbi:MAG: hypothetical protein JO063_11685 [Pseudonocardiales bacterium]|nr:hypothetical protein [Pseudonocardiales bacterium]MBV9030066.1 hypothetical protein [Pseudonocardiales bacterium]MBW0010758.1 hypothetical protein [Pseudonocardiales bacterium]